MATRATSSTEKILSSVNSSPILDGSTRTKPSFLTDDDAGAPPVAKARLVDKINAFFGNWYYLSEILGLTISAAAIASICVVVWYYDGKQQPQWKAPMKIPGKDKDEVVLTINSLLSILSVIGSTCAMVPVTKGLGQLKYLWFMQQDRKLADLDMFDSASRGKLGSAQLVWKLRLK